MSIALVTGCEREAQPVTAQAADQQVLHFKVTGMHCDGCAGTITDRLMELEGVAACSVSFEQGTADITITRAGMQEPIMAAVKELQYGIEPAAPSPPPND